MLRIVRCTADRAAAPEIDGYFARQVARLRSLSGNVDGIVGRRATGDEVAYALVTAWQGFDAMHAALGPDVVHAALLDPFTDRLRDVSVEHLERMDLPAVGGSGVPTVLRIYSGPIGHRQAETFYQFTRDRAWGEVGQSEGLVTAHVGRRMGRDVDHVALVTTWRSWDDLVRAFPAAAERPLVVPDDERLVEAMLVEHFDIVPPDAVAAEGT